MLRSRSFDLVNRRLEEENQYDKKLPKLKGSYGADLYALEQDRAIHTEPEEISRRRTIRLRRESRESWGFTLQTYGIRNKKTGEVEVMSYVDYIDVDGSAWMSGMRKGDIILSVNGESVENATHVELVHKIQLCRQDMRLVVLFENCCKKVELHERYIRLKKLLAQKLFALRALEEEEKRCLKDMVVSRNKAFRYSDGSSVSSEWDIYSVVTSPTTLNDTPSNQFAFRDNTPSEFDTSCDSLTLESSSMCEQWQPDASTEEICSSAPDLSMRNNNQSSTDSSSREFLQSGQSDISEISESSDNGLRRLYNITRCAQRISDAGRCEDILAFDQEESNLKNQESMTNLVEDSGIGLREVKAVELERPCSSISSSSVSIRDAHTFFIESDSDESNMNSELGSRVLQDISSISNSNLNNLGSKEDRNSANFVRTDGVNENVPSCDNKISDDSEGSGNKSEIDNPDNISNADKITKNDTGHYDYNTIHNMRKKNVKSDAGIIDYPRANRADSTTSSSSSKSSSSSTNTVSSQRFTKRHVKSVDEKPIFYQHINSTHHSHSTLSHSKHKEYSIQFPAPKMKSSAKRPMRKSDSPRDVPILLSYKKDDEELVKQNRAVSQNGNAMKKNPVIAPTIPSSDHRTQANKSTPTLLSETKANTNLKNTPEFGQSEKGEKFSSINTDENELSVYSQRDALEEINSESTKIVISGVGDSVSESTNEDSSSICSKQSLSGESTSSSCHVTFSKIQRTSSKSSSSSGLHDEHDGAIILSTSKHDEGSSMHGKEYSRGSHDSNLNSTTTTHIEKEAVQVSDVSQNPTWRFMRGILVNNQTQSTRL